MNLNRLDNEMYNIIANKQTPAGYYIDQIDSKLLLLKIWPDGCRPYNELFETLDDNAFLQKLKVFNSKLDKLIENLKKEATNG